MRAHPHLSVSCNDLTDIHYDKRRVLEQRRFTLRAHMLCYARAAQPAPMHHKLATQAIRAIHMQPEQTGAGERASRRGRPDG